MIDEYRIDGRIEAALGDFINNIAASEKFVSCYLTGSYVGGYAIEGASDIDLTLISNSSLTDQDQLELNGLVEETNMAYSVDLDISIIAQEDSVSKAKLTFLGISFREAAMSAKLAGFLIWGEDVLNELPMPPQEEYLESTKKIPFEFSNRIRNYAGLSFPLAYPDPVDKYFGYLRNDEKGRSTKPLISLLTWIGTGTVAHLSGTQIGNKKQCIDALAKVSPQQGAELAEIFDTCRRQWKYREPQTQNEQSRLRDICARALVWENEYKDRFFSNTPILGG